MNLMRIHFARSVCAFLALAVAATAQEETPEKPHLDKILERETFTPEEETALDVESQGGVTLPIYFSKPVTGTVSFDLGGTAEPGADKDFTVQPPTDPLDGEISTTVAINFEPWRGVGGEKVVRLSINRDPDVIPNNGTYASHLLRIRQFDAGEFTGTLSFPPASGLPALAVRIGLFSDGSAICAFSDRKTLLGDELNFNWAPGFQGFPGFPDSTGLVIPKEALKRAEDLDAELRLTRMAEPYEPTVEAFLEAFPTGEKPAMYHAVLSFDDLFAAGAVQGGEAAGKPYAITYEGELAIQPVNYAELP